MKNRRMVNQNVEGNSSRVFDMSAYDEVSDAEPSIDELRLLRPGFQERILSKVKARIHAERLQAVNAPRYVMSPKHQQPPQSELLRLWEAREKEPQKSSGSPEAYVLARRRR